MTKDTDIVNALKKNEPGAIDKMVALYGNRLLKSAYFLCENETDAGDLVQETLAQAIKAIKHFKGKSALYTWLYGILLNLNRQRKRKDSRLIFPGELPESRSPDSPDFENRLDRRNAYSNLHKIIKSLSVPHRETLVLRYFEGLKIEEIAKTLGISKGTVKSRIFYATRQIRKKMPEAMNLFNSNGTKERKTNEM